MTPRITEQDWSTWLQAQESDLDDLEPPAPTEEPAPPCPRCTGTTTYLGTLESKERYRCRYCGIDFNPLD